MFTSTRARTTLALNVLAAILVLILVSGCNTMEGVGEDIAWVGDSLSESAQTDEFPSVIQNNALNPVIS